MLSLRAFALEETRREAEARPLAERSLLVNSNNARAAHVLAHTYFDTAAHEEGRAFLSTWADGTGCSSPFRIHLRWHEALHHLALDDAGGVRASYAAMAADPALGPLALPDLASLLWRLRVLPVDGDLRDMATLDTTPMSRLAALIEPGTALVDAHAGIAHALTGDDDAHRRTGRAAPCERRAPPWPWQRVRGGRRARSGGRHRAAHPPGRHQRPARGLRRQSHRRPRRRRQPLGRRRSARRQAGPPPILPRSPLADHDIVTARQLSTETGSLPSDYIQSPWPW
jgi:hypothetical protein